MHRVSPKMLNTLNTIVSCGVCVVDVDYWFTASPGPSQTYWTLGLGGAAHMWCMSNHGTQETHNQERATVMAARNIYSVYYILPSPINIIDIL